MKNFGCVRETLSTRTKKLFEHTRCDAVLLLNFSYSCNDPNVFYYLGFELGDCALLLTPHKQELFVHPLALNYARRFYSGARKLCSLKDLAKPLAEHKVVGIDCAATTIKTMQNLKKAIHALPKRRKPVFEDVSRALLETRSTKDEREIQLLKHSAQVTAKAIEEISQAVARGRKSERKLSNEFAEIAYDYDAKPAFCIVASGRNSSCPHSMPSDKLVKSSEPLLIDAGVVYEGYCSDLTSCFNLNAKQEMQYKSLKEVFEVAKNFVKPGVSQQHVFAFAKKQFKSRGLPEVPHGVGHGIGLEVHELPSFRALEGGEKSKGKKENEVKKEKPFFLTPGMTFTIEPACYFKNYGLRYERMLVLGENRARLL